MILSADTYCWQLAPLRDDAFAALHHFFPGEGPMCADSFNTFLVMARQDDEPATKAFPGSQWPSHNGHAGSRPDASLLTTLKHRAKALVGQGLVSTRLHRKALWGNGIVVAFHRVSAVLPEDGLTKSPRDFESFCRFFQNNYDVVTLTEFVSRLESRKSVEGALAITFDDGYRDNFERAAPILKKMGLPATFFVTTGYMGSSIVPWWDASLPSNPGWMTWDQVRTLAGEGFDLGPHTRTHADLGIIDGSEAVVEIDGSRRELADAIGRVPEHFAYPYGGRDNLLEANRQRIRAAGFRCCLSCYGGLIKRDDDPFRLQRVPISPWYRTPAQFAFETAVHRA